MYCFYEGYISHDYAEVVTNHVLLTNAGMILREAWEQKKQLVKRQGEKVAQSYKNLFLLIIFRYADIMNREEEAEMVERLLKKQNMTKYRLAVEAGIPHATLNDICSGKTRLEKCSAETVYKLAKVLGVSMEMLTVAGIQNAERERAYEYGLPEYLQHDLDAYKEGLKNKSDLLDCLWGELYGSINIAEINDGAITREHAEFLRNKYLFGGKHDRND